MTGKIVLDEKKEIRRIIIFPLTFLDTRRRDPRRRPQSRRHSTFRSFVRTTSPPPGASHTVCKRYRDQNDLKSWSHVIIVAKRRQRYHDTQAPTVFFSANEFFPSSQCDGLRPICRACRIKNIPCSYNAEPDATPIIHLKRQYERLQEESLPTQQFLEALKSSSWTDAVQLLQSLRSKRDVAAALEDYRGPIDSLDLSLDQDDFGEGPSSAAIDDSALNETGSTPSRSDNPTESIELGHRLQLPRRVFDPTTYSVPFGSPLHALSDSESRQQ